MEEESKDEEYRLWKLVCSMVCIFEMRPQARVFSAYAPAGGGI
jgi:hypothetical protein